MAYIENTEAPVTFGGTHSQSGAIGVVALGTLTLPEIGDSKSVQVESGSVAFFRSDARVTYRSCGWGRAIWFFISL